MNVTGEPHSYGWPTPKTAYAKAPSVISEVGWTARHVRDALTSASSRVGRVFWLRKAALLDRIALDDERHSIHGDAWEAAIGAAHRLRVFDANGDGSYCGEPYWPEHPDAFADPRGYVRQEYAHWANSQ